MDSYYGELLPNTYTLKVSGYDFAQQLQNGLHFVIPFIGSSSILWLLSCFAIFAYRKNDAWLLPACLAAMPCIAVTYQIYVGGDPWLYWRQMTPSIIPLVMVAMLGLERAIEKLKQSEEIAVLIRSATVVVIITALNWSFTGELFKGKPFLFASEEKLVRMSNLLNDVMPESRILVIYAGVLPYYYNGYAIDALGKTDKYIARLPPDYNAAWNGMRGVPGHSKHSLQYDVDNKHPDFLQYLSWGKDNISSFADANFVAIVYKGQVACIRKNAPNVKWNLVQEIGPCSTYKNSL
ncbi:MAG: hypothetical protein HY306_02165 [Nitrosomonadales bacterium]|nr:hypothetical protein [Nitrosomonadales bacterium]